MWGYPKIRKKIFSDPTPIGEMGKICGRIHPEVPPMGEHHGARMKILPKALILVREADFHN